MGANEFVNHLYLFSISVVMENQSSASFQTDINSEKEDRHRRSSSSSSSSSVPESFKGLNMIVKLKNLTRKKVSVFILDRFVVFHVEHNESMGRGWGERMGLIRVTVMHMGRG